MASSESGYSYNHTWFWHIPGVHDGEPMLKWQAAMCDAGVPPWIAVFPNSGVGPEECQLAAGVAQADLQHPHGEVNNFHAVPAAWTAFLLCTVFAFVARGSLMKARSTGGIQQYVPEANLGPRNVMEMLIEGILGFAETTIGSRDIAVRYFPLFGAIFVYVLVCNLMGLVPGFLPATAAVSTNMAVALVVFVVFNYAGFKEAGLAYLKHLAGPVLVLMPVLFAVETFSLLIRPVTLSWRLYINMFADHLLLGVSSDLIPLILPSAFVGLGTFVCFVQAFVFMMLAVVYVALAVGDDDHH